MTTPAMSDQRLATRGQLRDLAIALSHFGITERAEALGYCAAVVGRPIPSRKTLTTREASEVLDHLDLGGAA
jgi:hypothetical protein